MVQEIQRLRQEDNIKLNVRDPIYPRHSIHTQSQLNGGVLGGWSPVEGGKENKEIKKDNYDMNGIQEPGKDWQSSVGEGVICQ